VLSEFCPLATRKVFVADADILISVFSERELYTHLKNFRENRLNDA